MEKLLAPLTEGRRKNLTEREIKKPDADAERASPRSPGQRDRDRVLYSSAFQRLAYVTQVTASESGHTFHNRLSHSLKVAQVGRRKHEQLLADVERGNLDGEAASLVAAADPDSVEACCLAHDLGHPPFGHVAEEELHAKAREHVGDGFEGNAQSFRIVTRLSVRAESAGLNLTAQTLDGMLKYPWRHRENDPVPPEKRERKWGYYLDDTESFKFARLGWPDETADALPERSLEAELMEWADDVTFAVHDADDFFRAALVPLDRLAEPGGEESKRFLELLEAAKAASPKAFPGRSPAELVEAASRVIAGSPAPLAPYSHTTANRAAMREFGSALITKYLRAFSLSNDRGSDKVRLEIDEESRCEVDALKMLVVVYVIRRPGLAVVQHGQKRVISDLFDWYFKASSPGKEGDQRIFPPSAKTRLADAGNEASKRARVVVDLISGLTETQAIQLHRRLSGGRTSPTLDATAQIG